MYMTYICTPMRVKHVDLRPSFVSYSVCMRAWCHSRCVTVLCPLGSLKMKDEGQEIPPPPYSVGLPGPS